jgi:hypothetical protein
LNSRIIFRINQIPQEDSICSGPDPLKQIGDPVKLLAMLVHYLLGLEILVDMLPGTLRDNDLASSCSVFL